MKYLDFVKTSVPEGRKYHMHKTFIYLFVDPRDQRIRYVGKSKDPLTRYHQHLRPEERSSHYPVARWIKKLQQLGIFPEMHLIECVLDKDYEVREKFWIQHYRNMYPDLLNITDGGEGAYGVSPTAETREKLGQASAESWAALSPADHVSRVSKMRASRSYDENFGQRVSEAKRGRRPSRPGAASAFTGVSQQANSNSWQATINDNGTRKYLGSFRTELGAASAYNREARILGLPLNRIEVPKVDEAPLSNSHIGAMKPNRTSRFQGVSWNTRKQRWIAQFTKAGKRKILGQFVEEEAAAEAYQKAMQEFSESTGKT